MKKLITYIFRHLAALLLMAMPVTVRAEITYSYVTYRLEVGEEIYNLGGSMSPITGSSICEVTIEEEPIRCKDSHASYIDGHWHDGLYEAGTEYYITKLKAVLPGVVTFRLENREHVVTEYADGSGRKESIGDITNIDIIYVIVNGSVESWPKPGMPPTPVTPGSSGASSGGGASGSSGWIVATGLIDKVDPVTGALTLESTLTYEEVLALLDSEGAPGPEFYEKFRGVCIKVSAGIRYIEIDVATFGTSVFGVMCGKTFKGKYKKTSRGTIVILFDLDVDTWIYVFPTPADDSSEAPRHRAPASGNGVEIYSLKVVGGSGDVSVTFAKEGFGTYYDSQNDVLLPAGMKALIVTADAGGGSLSYKTIADGDTDDCIVPAGTAVLLQTGGASAAQNLPLPLFTPAKDAITETNLLQGSDTETTTTGGDKYYKLTYSTGGTDLGWYWGAADGAAFTSGAHKVWLALPSSSAAKSFLGLPEAGTTGIKSLTPEPTSGKWEGWFDLTGRRLDKAPAKSGVYIHNGRKEAVR